MLIDFSKEKYDIIVLAGQSNSEGFGYGRAKTPYIPDNRIWYFSEAVRHSREYFITCAAERVDGNEIRGQYALSFAKCYVDSGLLENGRKLLILETAVGNTGFGDHRWDTGGDLYPRMVDMTHTALSLNPQNRLICFLWHQGETDALLKASFETHYQNLQNMLLDFRKEFNTLDLPFIAGNFTPLWREHNKDITKPVIAAIRAVCHDIHNCGFTETEGLLSNTEENHRLPEWDDWEEDDIHFSRNALYHLGKRYFDVYNILRFQKSLLD